MWTIPGTVNTGGLNNTRFVSDLAVTNPGSVRELVRAHPVGSFIVLAFVISWLMWLPLLAAVQGWTDAEPWSGLHLLGGLGPAVAPAGAASVPSGAAPAPAAAMMGGNIREVAAPAESRAPATHDTRSPQSNYSYRY